MAPFDALSGAVVAVTTEKMTLRCHLQKLDVDSYGNMVKTVM